MTDTPPDWVLIEAAKQCGWNFVLVTLERLYREDVPFRALCDMIERYEQPPVDRKLLCAREAYHSYEKEWGQAFTGSKKQIIFIATRAIELWESGYGA